MLVSGRVASSWLWRRLLGANTTAKPLWAGEGASMHYGGQGEGCCSVTRRRQAGKREERSDGHGVVLGLRLEAKAVGSAIWIYRWDGVENGDEREMIK
jgi:hypothetical protein